MANISLNGTTYDGTPAAGSNPWKPASITRRDIKIGVTNVAADGTRTLVLRGIKREWDIEWEKVNATTRNALRTLHALTTTFTFVDEDGTSWTVQTEEGDHEDSTAYTSGANVQYYDTKITLRQA
jgi:hypothetical protein